MHKWGLTEKGWPLCRQKKYSFYLLICVLVSLGKAHTESHIDPGSLLTLCMAAPPRSMYKSLRIIRASLICKAIANSIFGYRRRWKVLLLRKAHSDNYLSKCSQWSLSKILSYFAKIYGETVVSLNLCVCNSGFLTHMIHLCVSVCTCICVFICAKITTQ